MKNNRVSSTALRNAVLRAVESHRPRKERLFEDHFSQDLLNFSFQIILNLLLMPRIGTIILAKRERKYPGMIGNFICRTRYIDDVLSAALKKGLDQVVFLGAGLDSRPYRIPNIDQTRVFEVDHPGIQEIKMRRLERKLGALPSHVTFVPLDFNRLGLKEVMPKTGYRPEAETFFIWEGVTQYLKEEAVDATFRYLSGASVPGGRIIFTYINRGIIEKTADFKEAKALLAHHDRLGEPWIYGLDPDEISSYLSLRGFNLIEQVGALEYRQRYLDPLGRQMNIFRGEFTILAQIKRKEE